MIISIIVGIYGLLIGSFLNVCIYRLPHHQSIVYPGSACGSCHKTLKAIDLVPVLSWMSTGGKCRYCGAKVSAQYAVVELLTAALTVGLYSQLGLSFEFGAACLLLWSGIVITFIDFKHMIIPDGINIFLGVSGVIYYLYETWQAGQFLFGPILASLIGFAVLFLFALMGAMGGGDLKYIAAVGLFLSPATMGLALYFAFILGGMVALALVLLKKYKRKMEIPFGPYLVVGVLAAFLYGNEIINQYIGWMQF